MKVPSPRTKEPTQQELGEYTIQTAGEEQDLHDLHQTYVDQKSRRLMLQVSSYALSYFFWVTVHMQREFWAMSKKAMKQSEAPGMTMAFFGSLDTSLFFSYSIFQFCSGSIGDNFDKKKILTGSFLI